MFDKKVAITMITVLVVFKVLDVFVLDSLVEKLRGNFDAQNAEDDPDFN